MKVFYNVFIIVYLLDLVYCQTLTVISDITPKSIKDIGSIVKLTCTVYNPLNFKISWLKVNEDDDMNFVVLSKGNKVFINDTRFSLTQDVVSTKYFNRKCYTLQILDFQKTDAGIYRCEVLDKSNNILSANTEIDVRSAPTILFATKSLITRIGEPLTLECYAGGVPKPIVEWKRENNATFKTGHSVHRYNVIQFNVTKEDRGLYYCSAKNGVSQNAYHYMNVVIEFSPVVTSSKPIRTQALNYFINLECHIEAYPVPTIVWMHNGDELTSNQYNKITNLASSVEVTDSVLHINNITKYQFGKYFCKATNNLGTAEVAITLNENASPVCPPTCF